MSARRAVAAAVALAATVSIAAPSGNPAAEARTITMSGSAITGSLVADLAYFYRHAVRGAPTFQLTGGATDGGIADTARGITDAGLVSRALEPTDPPGLVLTPLARSSVCLITNRANPIASLSHDQVQDIVGGRVTNWAQVPGSQRTDAIEPITLTSSSGSARVFDDVFVDDDTPVLWQPQTVLTNAQERDLVAATPQALGYVELALSGPVHTVAYQGVACSRETVADGSYPAIRPLGVVTRGAPKGALAKFLRWARTSKTARRVILAHYLPW
jgi:phosphate transport system substrate-binding protein